MLFKALQKPFQGLAKVARTAGETKTEKRRGIQNKNKKLMEQRVVYVMCLRLFSFNFHNAVAKVAPVPTISLCLPFSLSGCIEIYKIHKK